MIPTLRELPARPKRIVLHWTGGTYAPNAVDRAAYHYLIDGQGNVHAGDLPVAANMRKVGADAPHARHTGGLNSYSVGVAFCAMGGKEVREKGPYGKWPLKRDQVIAGCTFVGELCHAWGLPVTRETVHTHAEASWRLGLVHNTKWDIDVFPWAPHLTREEVGDMLRSWVADSMPVDLGLPVGRPVETTLPVDVGIAPEVIPPDALPVVRLGLLDRAKALLPDWLRGRI